MAAIGVSDGIVVNQIHEDNDFFFFFEDPNQRVV